MEEISELSELNSLSLNSKTNKQYFERHHVEESESDKFYNGVGVTPKTKISNCGIKDKFSQGKKTEFIADDEESSAQGFYVSPVKVTKIDQGQPESHRRNVVTDRLMESSSDISMDDSLVLHNNRE